MGLFWWGAGVGFMMKMAVNRVKGQHTWYSKKYLEPWEFFNYMVGTGVVMVYWDGIRRIGFEEICNREEINEYRFNNRKAMVQNVFLSEPAIEKDGH